MKYYYLFILIGFTDTHILSERSELNKEQGKQIESLIITTSNEEKGTANKADSMMVNVSYYLGKLYDKTTPMVASNQFVKPVLKFGIPGKEPEYTCDNESQIKRQGKPKGCYSQSLYLDTNNWQKDEKKKELQKY